MQNDIVILTLHEVPGKNPHIMFAARTITLLLKMSW